MSAMTRLTDAGDYTIGNGTISTAAVVTKSSVPVLGPVFGIPAKLEVTSFLRRGGMGKMVNTGSGEGRGDDASLICTTSSPLPLPVHSKLQYSITLTNILLSHLNSHANYTAFRTPCEISSRKWNGRFNF